MENKDFQQSSGMSALSRVYRNVAKTKALAILSSALISTLERMKHPTFRVAMLVAPILLAVIGPFRSDIYDFWQALLLWAVIIWFSTVVGMVNRALVDEIFPRIAFVNRSAISSIVFGAYLTPIMNWVALNLGWVREPDLYPGDFQVFLTASFASFSVGIVRFYLFHAEESVGAVSAAQTKPAIFDRIAATDFNQIIRMTVDDHYVEIATDAGQERILMRFADAVREMGEGNGVLTHRSHWVNPTAVTGCRKDGAKLYLLMRDGAEVPVSKTYRGRVQDAGLLSD